MRQRKKTILSIMLLLVLMPFQNCSNRMEGINAATSGSSILSSVTSAPATIPATTPAPLPATTPVTALSFTQTPALATTQTSALFAFAATTSAPGALLIQCALDGSAFSNCTSPVNLTNLPASIHQFAVQATDSAGKVTAINYSWTISLAPVTTPAVAPVTSGMKSIFIGSGQGFRTMMSCDDGLSWIHDQTDAGALVGGESPGTSRGMDSGNGYIYAKYGWGSDPNNISYKGTIRRSRDGVNWDVIFTGDWGGGVAYGKDLLFTASASWDGNWQISSNNGLSWTKLTDPAVTSISGIPDHPPVFRLKDKIFISGRNQKIALSYDQGRTWTLLTSGFLGDSEARSFAEGNGVIVSFSFDYSTNNGTVSRSTDNGKTWTGSVLGGLWSPIIFNGTEFVGLSQGKTWKSSDGIKWSTTITKIDGVDAPPWWEITAQFNPVTGTYVGISSGWQQDYDKQRAYRSKDGINWTTLDATKFKGGNPMQTMIVGEIEAKYCP